MTRPPTEDQDQRWLAEYLDALGLRWFHVPNGGARPAAMRRGRRFSVAGARLKAIGAKAGVPDILIVDRPPHAPHAPGAALELKRRQGGRVEPEQQEWLDALAARGWLVYVARGAEDAADWLATVAGWSMNAQQSEGA